MFCSAYWDLISHVCELFADVVLTLEDGFFATLTGLVEVGLTRWMQHVTVTWYLSDHHVTVTCHGIDCHVTMTWHETDAMPLIIVATDIGMKANTQDHYRFGSDVGKQCLESVEALASHCLHQDGSMQVPRTAASMQHFLKASYTSGSTHLNVCLSYTLSSH